MRITTTRYETRRCSRYRWRSFIWCATVAFLGCLVAAQEFEVSRSTIDGGGVMQSTGGSFELSGTIGQPDAGQMSGGSLELTGGFWFAIPPADCDEDGLVNLLDAEHFVSCMDGPGVAPGSACRCFDIHQNSRVDLSDFAFLQTGFHGNQAR